MSNSSGSSNQNASGSGLTVKCGKNSATFYPDKLRAPGKKLGKCICFKGTWITPPEFESMSQVQAKKWKQSIKFGGRPIGDWLVVNEIESESQLSQQTRKNPVSIPNKVSKITAQSQSGCQVTGVNEKSTGSGENTDSEANGIMDTCSEATNATGTQSLETTTTEANLHDSPSTPLSDNPHLWLPAQTTGTGRSETSEMAMFLEDLETRLSLSMKELIGAALSSLKVHIENELQTMKRIITHLENKVANLEQRLPFTKRTTSQSSQKGDTCQTSQDGHIGHIENQVAQLSLTIEKQQQLIEKGERVKREKNVIIVGLNESEMGTEVVVNTFLQEKLNITTPTVTHCRRLGRNNPERSQPRPILVSFNSIDEKREIMAKKKMLAGTSIFINNDLTKEQMDKERELRNKRRSLLQQQEFKNKKIKIYRGRLWVNGSPIVDTDVGRHTNNSD